jgi:hypothetical protein
MTKPARYTVASCLLFAIATPASAQYVNYKILSPDELDRRCGENEGAACFYLGKKYLYGDGVPRDQPRAAQLYLQACKNGHDTGCADYDYLFSKNDGARIKEARRAAIVASPPPNTTPRAGASLRERVAAALLLMKSPHANMDTGYSNIAPGSVTDPVFQGNEGALRKYGFSFVTKNKGDSVNAVAHIAAGNRIDCIKFGTDSYCYTVWSSERLIKTKEDIAIMNRKLEDAKMIVDVTGSKACLRQRDPKVDSYTGTVGQNASGYNETGVTAVVRTDYIDNICSKPATYLDVNGNHITVPARGSVEWVTRWSR